MRGSSHEPGALALLAGLLTMKLHAGQRAARCVAVSNLLRVILLLALMAIDVTLAQVGLRWPGLEHKSLR